MWCRLDGLQAIILEDGTTAYLATQPSSLGTLVETRPLGETRPLDNTSLMLEQLTSHGVTGVINNGVLTVGPLSNDAQVRSLLLRFHVIFSGVTSH